MLCKILHWILNSLLSTTLGKQSHCSVMDIASACHADGPGSSPTAANRAFLLKKSNYLLAKVEYFNHYFLKIKFWNFFYCKIISTLQNYYMQLNYFTQNTFNSKFKMMIKCYKTFQWEVKWRELLRNSNAASSRWKQSTDFSVKLN